ncbi:hypothetical protein MXE81_00700 [Mammaliicoccus sciuri]|jgi:hypothetical protein|uniref:Tetratricopeptide repeat protein n=1 Tax=Mammaliicoccus sciuri TaxID=1296 RepID=A0AAI8DIH2_MAMSC|nr:MULTISPECIES: hypothetical protein [Mammaliicoccus]OOV37294.1 hypothetical protein BS756_10255 [Staphylococcus sp. MB371]PCQ20545.1 hypothetical protein CP995_08200 [Klebsiella pneumoniae]ASE34580.1 hypothetical protein CEP64_08275 [Mammaliicoccus sciuri]KTT81242.1 hypothetical protein NS1R_13060 [Mammaliicoccus sciuri]KTT83814.1 hypothetical protein NS202_04455 [Mammaliicoccus sciuri]
MYIKKSIERVSNFIEVGNEREAMMLLRDLEANVVRYDFEIMGDGFNKFAELYVSQKNRKKAIEMYQKAILYYREVGNQEKVSQVSRNFENLIL